MKITSKKFWFFFVGVVCSVIVLGNTLPILGNYVMQIIIDESILIFSLTKSNIVILPVGIFLLSVFVGWLFAGLTGKDSHKNTLTPSKLWVKKAFLLIFSFIFIIFGLFSNRAIFTESGIVQVDLLSGEILKKIEYRKVVSSETVGFFILRKSGTRRSSQCFLETWLSLKTSDSTLTLLIPFNKISDLAHILSKNNIANTITVSNQCENYYIPQDANKRFEDAFNVKTGLGKW
ncbi:MAG: hypothetical protein RLZZ67_60 [Candidatus Parcubacteria bacterium]|jgi:hypothetical protein